MFSFRLRTLLYNNTLDIVDDTEKKIMKKYSNSVCLHCVSTYILFNIIDD